MIGLVSVQTEVDLRLDVHRHKPRRKTFTKGTKLTSVIRGGGVYAKISQGTGQINGGVFESGLLRHD
jgi:hypothetical protein